MSDRAKADAAAKYLADRRALTAAHRAATPEALPCGLCPEIRRTPETLRVHRWLAHGCKQTPDGRTEA